MTGHRTNRPGDHVNAGETTKHNINSDHPASADQAQANTKALTRAISTHVPTKLNDAHPQGIDVLDGVTPSSLLQAVVDGDSRYLHNLVEQLIDKRVGLITVYEELLHPVTAKLGDMWRDDELSFVNVELATARLQMMCNRFANRFVERQNPNTDAKRIILTRLNGDQHLLGLSIVEVFFRQGGWHVEGGASAEANAEFFVRIENNHFDVVGISAGAFSVREISDTIRRIRQQSFNENIKIALGGPAITVDPSAFVPAGADLLTSDVRTIVEKTNLLVAAG